MNVVPMFSGLGQRQAWAPIEEPVQAPRRLRDRPSGSRTAKRSRFAKVATPWDLSGTELACGKKLIEGLTPGEAADALCMCEATFRTYIARAKEKMGARSTTQVAVFLDRYLRSEVKPTDFEVVVTFVNGVAQARVVLPDGGM